jgi:hypothetical protein
MAITTFDTNKFVRRLEQAGVPREQVEVQAEVLTEAFNVNLQELVTKEYLAVQFAEQNAVIEARFAKLNAKIDTNFTVLRWMVGIVLAAIVIPYLQQLLAL